VREGRHSLDDSLLHVVGIDVPHEGHVELDDLGLQRREAGQSGVAGSQVVHGQSEPELAQAGHAITDVGDLVERGAFGDLQDDAARDRRQRGCSREERLVGQIARVEIDEEYGVRRSQHRCRRSGSDGPPELRESVEALGGVEDGPRMRELRLVGAKERLVSEHLAVAGANDGLIGHPQRVDRPAEARFESRPVRRLDVRLSEERQGLALHPRHAAERHGPLDGLAQHVRVDGLRNVLVSTEIDRFDGAGDVRSGRGEEHREVQVAAAYGAQQLEPVHLGHAEIADDRVDRGDVLEPPLGFATVAGGRDLVPCALEDPLEGPTKGVFVVDDQHAGAVLRDHGTHAPHDAFHGHGLCPFHRERTRSIMP
jgi:hypothetical protein